MELIYFLSTKNKNYPVKIGYTNGKARKRLMMLQVGNPNRLEIIGVMPGTKETEQIIHLKFHEDRINGEWFKRSEMLNKFISENTIKAETLTEENINLAKKINGDDISEFMDIQECANYLKVNRSIVYQLTRLEKNPLKYYKAYNKYYFKRKDIEGVIIKRSPKKKKRVKERVRQKITQAMLKKAEEKQIRRLFDKYKK